MIRAKTTASSSRSHKSIKVHSTSVSTKKSNTISHIMTPTPNHYYVRGDGKIGSIR